MRLSKKQITQDMQVMAEAINIAKNPKRMAAVRELMARVKNGETFVDPFMISKGAKICRTY